MKASLQAQLTATKQRHILDAAARVFAEKGFYATSVKDVARAAGVAHGSIYNSFENKNALLISLFDLMSARALQNVAPPPGSDHDPRAFLRFALAQPLLALTLDNAELFRVIVSEVLVNRNLAERFRAQILDPMIRTATDLVLRAFYPDAPTPADLDLRVRVVLSLVFGAIVQRVMDDPVLTRQWDELPDLLADVLLSGLQGARG